MFALNKKLVAATALIAAGALATPAQAQDSYMPPQGQQGQAQQQQQQQQPGQAPQQQQQQADISDAQLQAFAEAQSAIRDVQTKYQSQAADVTSEDEVRSLQEKMNAEMIEQIEGAGLDVEEYRTITAALQTDPSIQEKYKALSQ
ncbi:MAG: DUF4168 domain-containing protein [Pseudomonadota bacterium]